MSIGAALAYSVLGVLVVFFALALIMAMIKIMTTIGDNVEKRNAAPTPAKAAIQTGSSGAVLELKEKLAPGSAGDLKLYDTEPRTAAMIMAIVADETGTPLNELRFLSIREIKEEK